MNYANKDSSEMSEIWIIFLTKSEWEKTKFVLKNHNKKIKTKLNRNNVNS